MAVFTKYQITQRPLDGLGSYLGITCPFWLANASCTLVTLGVKFKVTDGLLENVWWGVGGGVGRFLYFLGNGHVLRCIEEGTTASITY